MSKTEPDLTLIRALKTLSTGENLETAVNVDPANKRAVRKMLQKDLYLDPHPRFYE